MSTKTIAVDATVYRSLSEARREGESFSRAIGRLLDELGEVHSGRDILRGLESVPSLTPDEADLILGAVEEDRKLETWPAHDLR